jgi:hypothetical protein
MTFSLSEDKLAILYCNQITVDDDDDYYYYYGGGDDKPVPEGNEGRENVTDYILVNGAPLDFIIDADRNIVK